MGRIDDSILQIESIQDKTERALQLAGLLSTLFKLKGIALVVTGQLAFDSYANAASDKVELELAPVAGEFTPRVLLEVMRGQLNAKGQVYHWKVAGLPILLLKKIDIINPDLCRDFMTDHGVVKLVPAEEITADCILSAVYPGPDFEAQTRARLLLINGLTDAFHMNWTVLQTICDRPEYRVGEDLAKMRQAAKKDVDAIGGGTDHVGTPAAPEAPAEKAEEKPKPKRPPLEMDPNALF